MNTAGLMITATGVTIARILSKPSDVKARNVARVIIGGTFATAGLLVLDGPFPDVARGLAMVVMLTSLLVHGVALADASLSLVK